ncbi:hypothetical protein THAOC_10316, partial [Thalassiosira oceanica]
MSRVSASASGVGGPSRSQGGESLYMFVLHLLVSCGLCSRVGCCSAPGSQPSLPGGRPARGPEARGPEKSLPPARTSEEETAASRSCEPAQRSPRDGGMTGPPGRASGVLPAVPASFQDERGRRSPPGNGLFRAQLSGEGPRRGFGQHGGKAAGRREPFAFNACGRRSTAAATSRHRDATIPGGRRVVRGGTTEIAPGVGRGLRRGARGTMAVRPAVPPPRAYPDGGQSDPPPAEKPGDDVLLPRREETPSPGGWDGSVVRSGEGDSESADRGGRRGPPGEGGRRADRVRKVGTRGPASSSPSSGARPPA